MKMKWKYDTLHIWMVFDDHRSEIKDHVNFPKQHTQETYQKILFIPFTIFENLLKLEI